MEDTHIRAYLLGRLSPEEAQNFKARLAQDADLQAEVAFQKQILYALNTEKAQQRQLIRSIVQKNWEKVETEKEVPAITQPQPTFVPFWRRQGTRISLAAASVLLLLGIAYLGQKPSPHTDLYAHYYQPYQPDSLVDKDPRISSNERYDKVKRMITAYQQQQYQLCELRADSFLNELPTDAAYFYKGLSEMALQRETKALTHLQTLTQQNDTSEYLAQARWYVALLLLKKGEKQAAQQELLHLQQQFPKHRLIPKVEELLKMLER